MFALVVVAVVVVDSDVVAVAVVVVHSDVAVVVASVQ